MRQFSIYQTCENPSCVSKEQTGPCPGCHRPLAESTRPRNARERSVLVEATGPRFIPGIHYLGVSRLRVPNYGWINTDDQEPSPFGTKEKLGAQQLRIFLFPTTTYAGSPWGCGDASLATFNLSSSLVSRTSSWSTCYTPLQSNQINTVNSHLKRPSISGLSSLR